MNSRPADANDLRKRELELRRLIRQMKLDQLHTSNVYHQLENELVGIENQLSTAAGEKLK